MQSSEEFAESYGICFRYCGSWALQATSVLASFKHKCDPYRPDTRRCRSGPKIIGYINAWAEKEREEEVCVEGATPQISLVGALPQEELPAVSLRRGSCLSNATRSYKTHNSRSSPLCVAVSLFWSASMNSHTALLAAAPGYCIMLLLELREESRTAALLCFSWMSFHSPSAAFSPRSE